MQKSLTPSSVSTRRETVPAVGPQGVGPWIEKDAEVQMKSILLWPEAPSSMPQLITVMAAVERE